MKTYRLSKLETDLELCERYIRDAIKAETVNEKDKYLFYMAGLLGIDVEDLK